MRTHKDAGWRWLGLALPLFLACADKPDQTNDDAPEQVPPAPVSAPEHAMIRLTAPLAGAVVTSPLAVSGEARGNWYFEASFPVRLRDANGKELAVVPAQAQGEWMTTNFVPFAVTLTFAPPTTATGTLILEKDNPSGLPEHADSLVIPVRFP